MQLSMLRVLAFLRMGAVADEVQVHAGAAPVVVPPQQQRREEASCKVVQQLPAAAVVQAAPGGALCGTGALLLSLASVLPVQKDMQRHGEACARRPDVVELPVQDAHRARAGVALQLPPPADARLVAQPLLHLPGWPQDMHARCTG